MRKWNTEDKIRCENEQMRPNKSPSSTEYDTVLFITEISITSLSNWQKKCEYNSLPEQFETSGDQVWLMRHWVTIQFWLELNWYPARQLMLTYVWYWMAVVLRSAFETFIDEHLITAMSIVVGVTVLVSPNICHWKSMLSNVRVTLFNNFTVY